MVVCQPEAKSLAKTIETLIKTTYVLMCVTEHPYLTFIAIKPDVKMSSFSLCCWIPI